MDSFIIYFERIRDEVRDGKPLSTAVDSGWDRAKRTIVVSDSVNIVAAGVLYVLAVGGVQGFAFTLGLTTLVDLGVIFIFTHPMMTLLVKTRYFGEGRKFSGLDPLHLGASQRTYVHATAPRNKSRAKSKASAQVGAPAVSLARLKAGIAEDEAESGASANPDSSVANPAVSSEDSSQHPGKKTASPTELVDTEGTVPQTDVTESKSEEATK